jgi:hypothetical protein
MAGVKPDAVTKVSTAHLDIHAIFLPLPLSLTSHPGWQTQSVTFRGLTLLRKNGKEIFSGRKSFCLLTARA